MEPPKEIVLQLIEQITCAFTGVSCEGEVPLHQTRVLDDAFPTEGMYLGQGAAPIHARSKSIKPFSASARTTRTRNVSPTSNPR
ncbi:hypothetical protein IAD21_00058 [Abditibacteriota bacterium]|nr:hypothetical protein IAD21_00058 [Abditibacteriota bacterium]